VRATLSINRQRFLGNTLAIGTTVSAFGIPGSQAADTTAAAPRPTEFTRKIKLGVVSHGGRGAWIANLFWRHGGCEMWAVADYFQEVADVCGDALGVDKSQRFATLSGYKRLIESGVEAGAIGPVAAVNSHYFASLFPDPAFTANLESRLRSLSWCNDVAVGGGYHVNACIHGVDAALWVIGNRPAAAMGLSRRMRPDPHGDSHDAFSILFEFADGQLVSHRGKHLNNQSAFDVVCQVQRQTGYAETSCGGKAFLKGPEDHYDGPVENLYEAGAVRKSPPSTRVWSRVDSTIPQRAARWTAPSPPSWGEKPPFGAPG